MIPRPRAHIPVWLAIAAIAAAYLLRSLVVRDGDFSVDAADIVIMAIVVLGSLFVGWVRKEEASEQGGGAPREERDDEHDDGGGGR